MAWVVAARCDIQKCDQNATINAGGVVVPPRTRSIVKNSSLVLLSVSEFGNSCNLVILQVQGPSAEEQA